MKLPTGKCYDKFPLKKSFPKPRFLLAETSITVDSNIIPVADYLIWGPQTFHSKKSMTPIQKSAMLKLKSKHTRTRR